MYVYNEHFRHDGKVQSVGVPIMCQSMSMTRNIEGICPCAKFQGVKVQYYVAASIQTYGNYIPGKRPYGPKSLCLSAHGHIPRTLWYNHFTFQ